jgi:lysophospholipase L1-like esterase
MHYLTSAMASVLVHDGADSGKAIPRCANRLSFPWISSLVFLGSLFLHGPKLNAADSLIPKTRERLTSGASTKIVCLGDSVTGVYYHTGGRRAYPEMLQLILSKQFPNSQIEVVNAGISGNRTTDGLQRLERDVLSHTPHLVCVMFGLNDMGSLDPTQFQANLVSLVEKCRAGGAEVILCTPNGIMENPGRPRDRLKQFCQLMAETAREHSAAVCDVFEAYEDLRTLAPQTWRLLFSDEIHPNMDGHRLTARVLAKTISGEEPPRAPEDPPKPATPKCLARREAKQVLRILAMPPMDDLLVKAVPNLRPELQLVVKRWEVEGKTLAEIEASARQVRSQGEIDLVLVCVPAAAIPAGTPSTSEISSYSWILNHSLAFGRQEWDVVVVAPSVLGAKLTADSSAREEFTHRMTRAQDLTLIVRSESEADMPAEELLLQWLRTQGW